MQIDVIGSVGGDPIALTDGILARLLSNPINMTTGMDFRGKPGTRLYASDSLIMKRPCDESMTHEQAKIWCQRQIAHEKAIGGYHPSRTWAIFCRQEAWAVANITRRLTTLEQALQGPLPTDQKMALLSAMFDCFFNAYHDKETRQDEGLRNYVVDEGSVFYIDDDLYSPDNLTAFSVSLGSYIRMLPWIGPTSAFVIGSQLQRHIERIDPALIDSVYKTFSDTFLADDRESVRRGLQRGLGTRRHPQAFKAEGRFAVLADIHANLPALEAVLADCRARDIERGLVLGDLVGYGPQPDACVSRIRESGFHALMGNHDQAASRGSASGGLSRAASWSVPWTYQALNADQRHWLSGLPRYFHANDFYAVHGAPQDPTFMNAYVYARTADSNLDYMRTRALTLCLHGHSHLPGIWYRDATGQAAFSHPQHQSLDGLSPAMICPGSVGQPRDDDTAAQYLILDFNERTAEFVRVLYDNQQVISEMVVRGFPDYVVRLFGHPE